MNEYVTFEELKAYTLNIATATTADDDDLRTFCEEASRSFDAYCDRRFYPRAETRYYDHPDDATVLLLDDDLLAISSLTSDNGNDTITSGQYFLMCGTSYNEMPYDRVVMDAADGIVFEYDTTPQKANTVVGTWGYHDDWTMAWEDSADTVENTGSLSAAGTSLTVNDADGASIYAVTPRFRVQDLLKIDSEYVYVTAKDTSTNKLTIRRAINGTTAAAHDQNVSIYVYRPMRAIVAAIKRWAAYLYRQRDTGIFETTIFPETGTIVTPEGIPKPVKDMIARYKRRRRMVQ